MRTKILLSAIIFTLVCAIAFAGLYMYVSHIPRELIEYNSAEKWGASEHAHMAAYMTEDAGFNANVMLRIRSEIENAYTVDSIETTNALYCVSREDTLSLKATGSERTSSCSSTLYIGDYFIFHPIELIEGAYPERTSVNTDMIVIDELAAWQLFGTQRGVVGLEVMIGEDIFTVSGVASVPDGVYSKVYGENPRVYINADSAGLREGAISRNFTAFEAMLPDPITNFAKNTLTDTMQSFSPVIVDVDKRFKGKALDATRENKTLLITDSADTAYPYTEKAMIILELKASEVYAVQKLMMYLSLAGVAIIFCCIFSPAISAVEKLLSKLKF